MDKYQLINLIVVELNKLTVQGVDNMKIVIESIQRLTLLSQGLEKEIGAYQKRIEELEAELHPQEEKEEQKEE